MGRRRGGGKGRVGANGATAAAAGARDDDEEAAMPNGASSSLETPLLQQQQQQPLAPLPRAPKRGSSSSCFLADGILGGENDGDGGNGEVEERERSATALRQRRELARAAHAKTQRRLKLALALAAGFMVAEAVGGALANSLAIMSDAAHLMSDVVAQGIALAAGAASARRALPGSSHTFGHHRAEVLGALASTAATWAATAALAVAAAARLRRPEKVDGGLMFAMAVGGVFVNVLLLFVLGGAHGHGSGGGHSHSHSHSREEGGQEGEESHDHSHAPAAANLNLRGAWLHAVGDLLQSLGVAVAGAVVYFKPTWTLADPLVTLLFAVVVFATTRGIAGELLSILMEAAPARVDLEALERALAAAVGQGGGGVEDLHVWALSAGVAVGTARLKVVAGRGSSSSSSSPSTSGARREVLAAARRAMEEHGVAHSTIEVGEVEEDAEV